MGMEMVELMIESERRFGIEIPERDVQELRTVGQYHWYLLGRLSGTQKTACLSASMFYRVRRVMCALGGVSRADVRPEAKLEDLIPVKVRREWWPAFRKGLGVWLPDLRRPDWARSLIAVCVIGIAAALTAAICFGTEWTLPVVPLGSIVIVATLVSTRPLAVRFADDCTTVGDLVRYIMRRDTARCAELEMNWTADGVWRILQEIATGVFAVKPEKITPETRWYEDLNAG